MFMRFDHLGRRRFLLLAALLAGGSSSGLAHAQASEAAVAQAEVEVAEAELALARARLKLVKAGGDGKAPTSAAPVISRTAAAAPVPAPAPPATPENGEGDEAGDTTEPEEDGKPANESKPNNGNKEVAKGRQEFGGLEFGVGISFTADVGSNDRVTEAELVNGLVRVKDEDNGRARIMLESHYFFKPCQNPDGTPMLKKNCSLPFGLTGGDFGWGPFIALQPGTDNIIEAVAIGGMVGFRRPGAGTESFNLGLGLVIDPNTRILGDGIVANQPLPLGETTIRYKEKMQTGVLLLASFGF